MEKNHQIIAGIAQYLKDYLSSQEVEVFGTSLFL